MFLFLDIYCNVLFLDEANIKEHAFTKKEVIDVSLHIYVPKGTNIKFAPPPVKTSTWLQPIVKGKEVMRMQIPQTLRKNTSLKKTMDVIKDIRQERENLRLELVDKHCSDGAGGSIEHQIAVLESQQGTSKQKQRK